MRKRAAAVLVLALGASACGSAGPPPLGTAAEFGGGLECAPAPNPADNVHDRTLANGFYPLENHSGETVTVTSVRLVGGSGQKMTSAAYLVPFPLIGMAPWPPTEAPQWKLRELADGAVIKPHTRVTLVFAQTRTSDHPKPAAPEITYTASGSSYTLLEPVQTLVAVKCF